MKVFEQVKLTPELVKDYQYGYISNMIVGSHGKVEEVELCASAKKPLRIKVSRGWIEAGPPEERPETADQTAEVAEPTEDAPQTADEAEGCAPPAVPDEAPAERDTGGGMSAG